MRNLQRDKQRYIETLQSFGQEHIFDFWDSLNDTEKNNLLSQLDDIDFEELQNLIEELVFKEKIKFEGKITPAPIINIPETEAEKEKRRHAEETGTQTIKQGEVAALLVAGGQGSRLGYDGPKGTFPIGPISKRSLFQIHADKIKALNKKYSVRVPWYIMTSEINNAQTIDFFEKNNYFGLDKKDITFFVQDYLPTVDFSGKIIMKNKSTIFTSPNGTGGTVHSLYRRGIIDDMKARGVRYMFYFQVDNPLVKILDPVFIGYHVEAGAQMSNKIVRKRDALEPIGVIGKVGGKVSVIEYIHMSDEDKRATNPDGSLKYWAGSIATHIINVDLIEGFNKTHQHLPVYKAIKKIPHIDKNGEFVTPESENGIKFETFIFDIMPFAKNVVTMEVIREEEFAPVKNASGEDSPASARTLMTNLFGKWLEQAGVDIPRDSEDNVRGTIEINPLYALDANELKEKITESFAFNQQIYLK